MSGAGKLAWGILGTGNIAQQFAAGIQGSERGVLAAVGSRRGETAKGFAGEFGAGRAHGSYEGLLADKDVQAVYVSLPNSMHHEWTLRALEAGKHVLCEKPLATNLAEAREMFAGAKRAGRILVDSFMYRSHPMTLALQRAITGGAIGKIKVIRTSFIYPSSKIAGNVRFSQPLAGGSLMDIGCYCLSYSRLFAGAEPTHMSVTGHIHETGVDDYAAGVMGFPGEIAAIFACGMTIHADNTATILGTQGYAEIPMPWKPPAMDAEFTIVDAEGKRETTRVSAGKHLYALEADEFAAAVAGEMAVRVSEQDSLGNQHCLDVMRRQIGVVF